MDKFSKEERLKIMMLLAEQIPTSASVFNRLYYIVTKYDVPKHVDRQFVYDSLITYFSSLEQYEKCVVLKKFKEFSSIESIKIKYSGFFIFDFNIYRLS